MFLLKESPFWAWKYCSKYCAHPSICISKKLSTPTADALSSVFTTSCCCCWDRTFLGRIGRKKSLGIATLMRALVVFIMAWAPNYTAFIILRLLSGLFGSACYINGFVMSTYNYANAWCIDVQQVVLIAWLFMHPVSAIETVSPTWRVHASTACLYMWTVGYMGTALLGYLIRDWFTLQLVIGITSCPVLLYIW